MTAPPRDLVGWTDGTAATGHRVVVRLADGVSMPPGTPLYAASAPSADAAQPAEPRSESAPMPNTGTYFATAEPTATDDLVKKLLDGCPADDISDNGCENERIMAAFSIKRHAREIAMLRLAVKDDAQWAQENERLTRERDEWKCKCGDANVWGLRNAAAWKERAERSEAERDALRECVLAADVMRAGYSVMWGERPTSTLDAYDAARAKVKP